MKGNGKKYFGIGAAVILVLLIALPATSAVTRTTTPGVFTPVEIIHAEATPGIVVEQSAYEQYQQLFAQYQTQLNAINQYITEYAATHGDSLNGMVLTPTLQGYFDTIETQLTSLYQTVGLPSSGYQLIREDSTPVLTMGESHETPEYLFYGITGVWHKHYYDSHGDPCIERLVDLNNALTKALRLVLLNFGVPAAAIFIGVMLAAHIQDPWSATIRIIFVWELAKWIVTHAPEINQGYGILIYSWWAPDVFPLQGFLVEAQTPGQTPPIPPWQTGWG
ncbi:MAG: hypothetical protein NT038_06285 [Euryarchaeota archaeon]|nr:hypothetical protein [Euryarchaeota archaeon]